VQQQHFFEGPRLQRGVFQCFGVWLYVYTGVMATKIIIKALRAFSANNKKYTDIHAFDINCYFIVKYHPINTPLSIFSFIACKRAAQVEQSMLGGERGPRRSRNLGCPLFKQTVKIYNANSVHLLKHHTEPQAARWQHSVKCLCLEAGKEKQNMYGDVKEVKKTKNTTLN